MHNYTQEKVFYIANQTMKTNHMVWENVPVKHISSKELIFTIDQGLIQCITKEHPKIK